MIHMMYLFRLIMANLTQSVIVLNAQSGKGFNHMSDVFRLIKCILRQWKTKLETIRILSVCQEL